MPFQLKSTGSSRGDRDFYFTKDAVRIGRLPDNDLVLYDTGVSRYHCEIICLGDIYTLRDVGSANGTLLNGASITETEIYEGDEIVVGPITLKFCAERPREKRNPRLGGHAGLRPEDSVVRRLLEDTKTKAMTLEQLEYERDRLAAAAQRQVRATTGRFASYHRLAGRYGRLGSSTRLAVAVLLAAGVATIAILTAIWIDRPPADRSHDVFKLGPEVAQRSFGNGKVDVYTLDRAQFAFDYEGGSALLTYRAADIDTGKEVSILLNGAHLAYVAPAAGYPRAELRLPRKQLKTKGNIIAFDNTLTPVTHERWRVRGIQVVQRPLLSADPQQAKVLRERGTSAFAQRTQEPSSLYLSIEFFREALKYIEALDPAPPLATALNQDMQRSIKELERVHNALIFSAQKAMNFGDQQAAVQSLRELLRYYPNQKDERYISVRNKLQQWQH